MRLTKASLPSAALAAALGCASPATPPPAPAPSPAPEVKASAPAAAPAPTPLKGKWWRDDVFYEIFVRSFADSNGDGIGDIQGLIGKLDYLNDGDPKTDHDLGITGIWLMPMQPSPSYHGYDVTDYLGIESDYGTMADFEQLLAEAHKRGIRIITDFVLNHSSREHPWFVDAKSGPKAKHRAYYTFRDTPDPRWKKPWGPGDVWHPTGNGDYYYGLFWAGMPDLNLAHPEVEETMVAAMRTWLERGVDGFRVDAVRHLFESEAGLNVDQPEAHAFMQRARARLKADFPEALLVAEAWTNADTVATYYGEGNEFDLAFSFDAGGAMVTAAKDGLKVSMAQYHANAASAYADRGFEAPFLTNHDMPRVMRQLAGDAKAMRMAAGSLFAMPGTPFVYYGEEIGMQGGAERRDEDKRTPMRWAQAAPHGGFTTAEKPWHSAPEADDVAVDAQSASKESLLSLYRRLIRVRRDSAALSDGHARVVPIDGGGRGGFALLREEGDDRVLFVANYHRAPTGPVSIAVAGQPSLLLTNGPFGPVSGNGTALTIPALPAQGFAFIRLK